MEMSGQIRAPANLPPANNSGGHVTGGWMGPSACMDVLGEMKNLSPLPGFQPRSLALYRLQHRNV